MKKNLLLLFLSFILFFAAACGGEEKPETTPTPLPTSAPTSTPTPSPSPTPEPENGIVAVLETWEEKFHNILGWEGTGEYDAAAGLGYDASVNISVNRMLLNLLGMGDLSDIRIDLDMDIKDALFGYDIVLSLGDTPFFDYTLLSDGETILMNVPKYSSQYALAESYMNQTGNTETAVRYEELLPLLQNFVSDSFGSIQPAEEYTDNATFEIEGYKVTGRKFSATLSVESLNTVLHTFADSFATLFPDAETTVSELPTDLYETLVVDYYTNENGTYAWVLYPDNAPEEPMGLICAENGTCFFIREQEENNILFYTEKTGKKQGILYLPDDDSTMTLEYSLGDHGGMFYAPDYDLTVSGDWLFEEKHLAISFSMATTDFTLSFLLKSEGNDGDMTIDLISYDTKLASITSEFHLRDYKEVTLPESYLDAESWMEQLDTASFRADIETLAEASPEAMASFLIGFYEGFTRTDITPENDEPVDIPSDEPYENAFSSMTGYYADENGDVYFNPSGLEVLGLGIPSTGFYYTGITADQRQALITYVNSAFADDYEQSGTSYLVYGNIYDNSVVSQYYSQYRATDNTNGYNVSDLFIEIITGHFIEADIYRASREDAFAAANEILAILGETETLDSSLDEISLYDGVWIGNFIIYGVDYGEYYCISIY